MFTLTISKGMERSFGMEDCSEVDVYIVGEGAAGLSAGLEACKAASDTVILEKLDSLFESSTAICHGFLAFAGTDLQRSKGLADSPKHSTKSF